MKSSELIDLSNLDGWRIGEGYFIELKHGLMGSFPALVVKTGKPFVCLSKEAVAKAVSLLSDRPYNAAVMLFLINDGKKIAFALADVECQWRNNSNQRDYSPQCRIHYESESLVVFAKEDLDAMKVGDIKWAPGLIGPGTTREEFAETLVLAAKQGK